MAEESAQDGMSQMNRLTAKGSTLRVTLTGPNGTIQITNQLEEMMQADGATDVDQYICELVQEHCNSNPGCTLKQVVHARGWRLQKSKK